MNKRLVAAGVFSLLSALWLVGGCGGSKKEPASGGSGSDEPDDVVDIDVDVEAENGAWSNPATWGGAVPQAGDTVLIPEGVTVVLDQPLTELGDLQVDGTLQFGDLDIELRAKTIMVHGSFIVGTENDRFEHSATITLTDTDQNRSVGGMGTRGLVVMGGVLELHGLDKGPSFTHINQHADAGATQLELAESVGWSAGDEIAIAPTDYFKVGRSEKLEIEAIEGATIDLVQPLEKFRWGQMQYVTLDGASTSEPPNGLLRTLDERAEVVLLSRNIVIQGADDAAWAEGFGGHVMIMPGSEFRIEGVEFRRMGQAGRLARYPVHFHLMSYESDGSEIEMPDNLWLRDSSIWDSVQRCVVIHGTNHITIEDNVCFDIVGHAFFLEDAVERKNQINRNIALHIHEPSADKRLLAHEEVAYRQGPSGFWITNPDNVIQDNVAADCVGNGFWFAFPEQPQGLSTAVPIYPMHMKPADDAFSGSKAHSNGVFGMISDLAPANEEGDVIILKFTPTEDETPETDPTPFVMENFVSYKHEIADTGGAFWNNSMLGTYRNFLLADFTGLGFRGRSQNCLITGCIVMSASENNFSEPSDNSAPAGFASYHSECDIVDNVLFDLPYVEGQISGAFSTFDYYLRPVELGLVRNVGNTLVRTHPGYRFPAPNIMTEETWWTLAGALWDPNGHWGPAGNYWVYDVPFLTDGTECTPTTDPVGNGTSCVGPYYGMERPIFDGVDGAAELDAITFARVDNDTEWFISDGRDENGDARAFAHLRHAAAVKGGEYAISSPGIQPTSVSLKVTNIGAEQDDEVLIGLTYSGSPEPGFAIVRSRQNGIESQRSFEDYKNGDPNWQQSAAGDQWLPLSAATSLDEVRNGDGTLYWVDTDAELVWVLLRGGLMRPDLEQGLYTSMTIEIDEAPH